MKKNMKNKLLIITVIIVAVAVFMAIGFGTGYLGVGYTKTVVKAQQNANTEVFHETQAYIDGATADIAKVKLEYDQSTDVTAKHALINYVRASYPNLDISLINNTIVKDWYIEIQNDEIN